MVETSSGGILHAMTLRYMTLSVLCGIVLGFRIQEISCYFRKDTRYDILNALHYLMFPNSPPNSPEPIFPPPPPPLPPLLASVLIHSFNHSRSFIILGSVTFVSICASPLSKLNNVGILVIIYVNPNPLSIISGESYSISQNETPPSSSPMPEVMSSSRMGETFLHVLQ